jgi:hypothetical protein
LDGPLPKLCPAVTLSHQDGRHSAVVLLLKAALIQVSDYRLLGASGILNLNLILSFLSIDCHKDFWLSSSGFPLSVKAFELNLIAVILVHEKVLVNFLQLCHAVPSTALYLSCYIII